MKFVGKFYASRGEMTEKIDWLSDTDHALTREWGFVPRNIQEGWYDGRQGENLGTVSSLPCFGTLSGQLDKKIYTNQIINAEHTVAQEYLTVL